MACSQISKLYIFSQITQQLPKNMNSSGSMIHQSVYESHSHQNQNSKNTDAPFILQTNTHIKKTQSANFILSDKNSREQNNYLSKIQQTPFILQSKVKPVNIIDSKKSISKIKSSKSGNVQSHLMNKTSLQSRNQNSRYVPAQGSSKHIQNKNSTASRQKDSLVYSQQPSKILQNKLSLQSKKSRNDILEYSKDTQPQRIQKTQYRPQPNKVQYSHQNKNLEPNPYHTQSDRPFIKYYQQNIQLKTKQKEMERQIQQLKNQLYEQSLVKRAMNQRQLQALAAGKRNTWSAKPHYPQKLKNMQHKDKDSNKITNLLQIIEHYKQKLVTSQEQIQNLRRQKHLLQQDGALKQRKAEQILKTFKDSQQKVNTTSLQQQLLSTTRMLQIQKQRNKFNEADIKRLETKIRTLQLKQDEMDELRIQKKSLQQKLIKLTSMPSFHHVNDKVQSERRVKEYEQKYKAISEKYGKLNQKFIKTQAQVKLLRNQLIKANLQSDQLQKQNQKLREYSLQNPVLSRLAEDQDLLAEVVLQIRNRKQTKQNQKYNKKVVSKQNYEEVLLEKQELANQIGSLRNKMALMQQTWKQKQRMSKLQKQELISTFKQQAGSNAKQQTKVMSKNGVPYTDDVSMFTQDTVTVNAGFNYFDLYLGELHLLQTMLITTFNIRSTENTLILATVDFYNHNTQTTRPVHGVHSNLQSQFSFKITQDQFFFKYLNKGNFSIQIWASQGNKRINLGKATIDLRPLVLKSKKNLAPVANSSSPLYMNQKVIGSLNFVMRLRLPIFEQLQRINQIQQLVSTQQVPVRKLVIQIQQGRGFLPNSNTFVYYPFRLEDYYTKTFKGSNPIWNHLKTLQLKYNNDLKNYLRKNQLQFVVLDDNAIVTGQGDSDVIGSAYVSLVPLLQNKIIRDRVTVMKGTQKVGQIDIKIFWHELQSVGGSQMRVGEVRSLADQIKVFLINNNIEPEAVFYSIDNNKTGMISFEQFHSWVLKINPKISYDMINIYYKQFKQPVNLINFTTKLNQLKQSETSEMAKQLSAINRLVSQNTEMIKKKQSLQDYLKEKDITTVLLDIDKSQNGMISKQELQEYFEAHNIEPPAQKIGEGQIKLTTFLRKYKYL